MACLPFLNSIVEAIKGSDNQTYMRYNLIIDMISVLIYIG